MKSLLLVFVAIVLAATCLHAEQGWYQIDGTPNRNRYSDYSNSYTPVYKSVSANVIPSSMIQHKYQKRTYGIALDATNQESIVVFSADGSMRKVLDIPKDVELMNVLPVLDNDENYYTVRRNKTNNSYFVMRSYVGTSNTPSNNVLFDTKTMNHIKALVLTDSGLVIASGNYVVCVDGKSGTGKWVSNLSGVESGIQFLLDGSNLYALTRLGISLIDLSSGKVKTASSTPTTPSGYQEYLTVGSNFLVVFDSTYSYKVNVLDKNNLSKGNLVSINLFYQNGVSIDLSKCSNAMSIGTLNSFFMVCHAYNSYHALRFDVSNTTVSLGYKVDFNSLFGLPTTVCSSQIAEVYASSKAMFATACDSGLILFSADGTQVPRKETQISVTPATQVFGGYYNFFILTSNKGTTEFQSLQ